VAHPERRHAQRSIGRRARVRLDDDRGDAGDAGRHKRRPDAGFILRVANGHNDGVVPWRFGRFHPTDDGDLTARVAAARGRHAEHDRGVLATADDLYYAGGVGLCPVRQRAVFYRGGLFGDRIILDQAWAARCRLTPYSIAFFKSFQEERGASIRKTEPFRVRVVVSLLVLGADTITPKGCVKKIITLIHCVSWKSSANGPSSAGSTITPKPKLLLPPRDAISLGY
jgi:hypothetical protein